MAANKKDLDEMMAFAKRNKLMNQPVLLVYSKFIQEKADNWIELNSNYK